MTENDVAAQILAGAEQIKAGGASKPRAGRDPINMPMIRNWLEAIGDENPIYVDEDAAVAAGHGGIVAPPAMAQVWTMRGSRCGARGGRPLGRMTQILDDAGYTSVVATNCDQIYHRYLRPGEEVTIESTLEEVVGPKRTGLGEGGFFTTRNFLKVAREDGTGEIVAEMMFRILNSCRRPRTFLHPKCASVPEDLDPTRMMRAHAVARHPVLLGRGGRARTADPAAAGRFTATSAGARALEGQGRTTDYVVASGRGTCSASSSTTPPRCPAGRCRSWWRSSSSRRACACSANCATSTRPRSWSACR